MTGKLESYRDADKAGNLKGKLSTGVSLKLDVVSTSGCPRT